MNEVMLCPGVNVTGVVIPETLKPVPEAFTCEMVAFTATRVCTVSKVRLKVCPIVTFVNVRLVGLAAKVAAETEVPLSAMVSDGFEAFEVTVTLPLTARRGRRKGHAE